MEIEAMESVFGLWSSLSLLATEAAEAEAHGFGLNFDIFESNLINLTIVAVLLFYFGRNFLGRILSDRRSAIETAIKEAEDRKKKAAAALAEQQQKLAQAQEEAAQIRASATTAAEATRAEILAKSEKDLARLREDAAQELNTEQERVINELRQRVVAMALERAEATLPGRLNPDVQQRLIDQSIAQLGGS